MNIITVQCSSSSQVVGACNSANVPLDRNDIAVAYWNMNGKLSVALTRPLFINYVSNYDIFFFSKTHWLIANEDSAEIPNGYRLYSVTREPNMDFNHQYGGVAALVKSLIQLELMTDLCALDLLCLRVGNTLFVGSYILPENSTFAQWTNVHPVDRLGEILATAQAHGYQIVLLGDLNARTADKTSNDNHPT